MDEDLMFETGTKILEDRLNEADFDNIFVLFEQVCNSDDILTFTLKGYCESFWNIRPSMISTMKMQREWLRNIKTTR